MPSLRFAIDSVGHCVVLFGRELACLRHILDFDSCLLHR